MLAIQQDPTPDLNPETLGALSALMLAQGQEIFVQKAIHGMRFPLFPLAVISDFCSKSKSLLVSRNLSVGIKALTMVILKHTILWDVSPCSLLDINRHFWGNMLPPLSGVGE
jgi:hypothetical protein